MNIRHGAPSPQATPSGIAEHYQTPGRTIRWARLYDVVVGLALRTGLRGLREQTLDLVPLRPGDRVLDVGCGPGDLALAAWRRVGPQGRVYGIDAATEMVEVARRKASRAWAQIEFRVEPVERLSFPDHTFDVVLSSLMLHHLPDALQRQGIAEMIRVLRPGGQLLVVDFPPSGPDPRSLIGRMHRRVAPALTAPAGHPTRAAHAGHPAQPDHTTHAIHPAPTAQAAHQAPTVGLGAVPAWLKAAGLVQITAGDLPAQGMAYVRGRMPA
jgi:ubiquinone/menaquinone biosynthesis C-methylase UbiE